MVERAGYFGIIDTSSRLSSWQRLVGLHSTFSRPMDVVEMQFGCGGNAVSTIPKLTTVWHHSNKWLTRLIHGFPRIKAVKPLHHLRGNEPCLKPPTQHPAKPTHLSSNLKAILLPSLPKSWSPHLSLAMPASSDSRWVPSSHSRLLGSRAVKQPVEKPIHRWITMVNLLTYWSRRWLFQVSHRVDFRSIILSCFKLILKC